MVKDFELITESFTKSAAKSGHGLLATLTGKHLNTYAEPPAATAVFDERLKMTGVAKGSVGWADREAGVRADHLRPFSVE